MPTFTHPCAPTMLVGGEFHASTQNTEVAKRLLCIALASHGQQGFTLWLPRVDFPTSTHEATEVNRSLRFGLNGLPRHAYMLSESGEGNWYRLTSVG